MLKRAMLTATFTSDFTSNEVTFAEAAGVLRGNLVLAESTS